MGDSPIICGSPSANLRRISQGGTLGPLASKSAWIQADMDSQMRAARLSLPEWTQSLNEKDLHSLTVLKYKLISYELITDSNEEIRALRCELHSAKVKLQEECLDENELSQRKTSISELAQLLWIKIHKTELVEKDRQALDIELARCILLAKNVHCHDDGVPNYESKREQSDSLCSESECDSDVSGVPQGGALSPSHVNRSPNAIMRSCTEVPMNKSQEYEDLKNKYKDLLGEHNKLLRENSKLLHEHVELCEDYKKALHHSIDSSKVIDSTCQVDLPNPQEESQKLRLEECIRNQFSMIQELSGKLHQACDTIDHLKQALAVARSKESTKVVDAECQAELPDPMEDFRKSRDREFYLFHQRKVKGLSNELEQAYDVINQLKQEVIRADNMAFSSPNGMSCPQHNATTQVDSLAMVDTASQYDSPTLVESASQVEFPLMVDSTTQGDSPTMMDSAIQYDSPIMVDSNTQEDPPSMVDTGFQVDPPVLVESGSQVDPPVLVESGSQVDPPVLVESGSQVDPPVLVESGSQVDPPVMVESGTQMDPPTLVESGSQVDPLTLVESGSQVDPPALVESGPQVDIGEYGLDESQITQVESDVEDLDTTFMSIPDGEYLDAECGLDSGYVDSDLWEALEPSQSEVTDDSMSIPDDEYLDAECGLDSGYVDLDLLVELESSDSESLDYMSSSDDECLDITEGSVSTINGEMSKTAGALPDVDTLN